MAMQDMQGTPPAGGNDPMAGGAPAPGGDPNAGGGGGQGDLAAQVVFRFYKSGFVTVMGMDEKEEPIKSLDDAVGILAAVAQQTLPKGGGEMGGGKPEQEGAGEPGGDNTQEEGAEGDKGAFKKGFNKVRGGGGY